MCCFVDMHLFSNILSATATISFLILLELLSACFFCSNNFNLSNSSLQFSAKNYVANPEAMLAGDSSKFIRDLD